MTDRRAQTDPEIVVVGSVHMDLIATAPRVPLPGESVLGTGFAMQPGGKAGNQAISAARQGARAAIVAKVGSDAFGQELQEAMGRKGVDVTWLRSDDREPTGASPILKGEDGAYASIIIPGASRALGPEDLAAVAPLLRSSAVVMLQFEIGVPATLEAARVAATGAAKVLLNASPPVSSASLSRDLWSCVDVVIVNQTEAEALLDIPDTLADDPARLARELKLRLGIPAVVITLGASGMVVADDEGESRLTGFDVAVVDTIGAGDTFAGALAAALVRGVALRDAVAIGNAAGALAVGTAGAYDAAPTLAETLAFLASRSSQRG